MTVMTQAEVEYTKELLRKAVVDDILDGWNHYPGAGKREWLINPVAGVCDYRDASAIRDYCALLTTEI